jgi:CheY-like chemotaxis protein
LEGNLSTKQFDAIFIPYSLSNQNYLELSGIRLALHIRLSPEFNHSRVPIVFIGHETREQIAKLTEFASFLFTSGVFSTMKFEFKNLLKISEWLANNWKPDGTVSLLTNDDYRVFLNRVKIEPPSNYLSHHSIDNELALLRWSEYLKCDGRISEVKDNLQSGLYFKYHRVLHPVNPPGKGSPYLISGRGKVLIDDESGKGWTDFYEFFFQNNIRNGTIEFESLEVDFKSLSQDEIIEAAMKKVEEFEADVVLLDLRLCDKDFNTNPQLALEDLTGYTILEEIKKINRGIQVIITTASNKVWSYQLTHELGANGYIVKRGDSDAAEDVKSLKRIIEACIVRASYLKSACRLSNLLEDSLDGAVKGKKVVKNFGKELIQLLNLSFN